MPSVKEIITGVRELCGNPAFDSLNNGTVCLHLYDELDDLLNRLNLTEANWIINRQTITVAPNLDEYALNTDFGRAILVETVPDGQSDFRRREVQMVEYHDFNLYWNGYTTSYVYSGNTHSAEVCCFFNKLESQSSPVIRFAPPPQVSCDYKIYYEIGRQAPPKLAEKPKLMEQFHNLLKVKTAKTCLPHCFKGDEASQAVMQAHWMMLSEKEARFDDTFERYITQGYQEDTGPRRSFNSNRSGWEGF